MPKIRWKMVVPVAGQTPDGFRHGPDVTITRANIEMCQFQRAERGADPLTADQLVRVFVQFPEPRHYERAQRLMAARPVRAAG